MTFALLALLACSVVPFDASAQEAPAQEAPAEPPPWGKPTAEEVKNYEMLLKRFTHKKYGGAVMADPKNKLTPVLDALKSLSEDVVVEMACADKTKRKLTVRTFLRGWSPRGEAHGYYEWGGVAAEGDDDGNATYGNVIAFDVTAISDAEKKSGFGQVDNVVMMYHELLHGQLVIDAAKADAAWIKGFCDTGQPDFGPGDLVTPHNVIPNLENRFREALWAIIKNEKTLWSAKE